MLILEHDAAAESAPCRVTKGQEATSPAFCRGLQELAEAGAADPRARVLWRWLRVLRQPPRLMSVRSRREGPLPGALPVTMANEAMATLRPARSLPRKRPSPTRQESSIPPRAEKAQLSVSGPGGHRGQRAPIFSCSHDTASNPSARGPPVSGSPSARGPRCKGTPVPSDPSTK